MNYILGFLIVVWVIYAVYAIVRGDTGQCSGDCATCHNKHAKSKSNLCELYYKDHPKKD